MAGNWKEILKSIDHATDHLLHGYIREGEKLLKNHESVVIPPLVIYTVLMYYWLKEYFAVINDEKVSLSNDKMKLGFKVGSWTNSSFGNFKIDSMCNNIYKWRLKIESAGSENLLFGISSGNDTEQVFVWDLNAFFYGVNAFNGEKITHKENRSGKFDFDATKYISRIGCNDEVKIVLDLSNKCISFCVNDEDKGIAFDNVKCEKGLEYRLVVSSCSESISIELLDLEIIYS